jgi:hypothetical protein
MNRRKAEQIVNLLRQADEELAKGIPAEEIYREVQISLASCCRWQSRCGGLQVPCLLLPPFENRAGLTHGETIAEVKKNKGVTRDASMSRISANNGSDALSVPAYGRSDENLHLFREYSRGLSICLLHDSQGPCVVCRVAQPI